MNTERKLEEINAKLDMALLKISILARLAKDLLSDADLRVLEEMLTRNQNN